MHVCVCVCVCVILRLGVSYMYKFPEFIVFFIKVFFLFSL